MKSTASLPSHCRFTLKVSAPKGRKVETALLSQSVLFSLNIPAENSREEHTHLDAIFKNITSSCRRQPENVSFNAKVASEFIFAPLLSIPTLMLPAQNISGRGVGPYPSGTTAYFALPPPYFTFKCEHGLSGVLSSISQVRLNGGFK